MIWDSLSLVLLIFLCSAGWKVGLINSWRGPFAMLIATILTQQLYINFATWICEQTLAKPSFGTFLAYLTIWLSADIVIELVMTLVLVWERKESPLLFDRLAGVMFAIIRWAIICSFPLIAMNTANKVPEPPAKVDYSSNVIKLGEIEESSVLSFMAALSKSLTPVLGKIIVSDKEPSIKPDWESTKVDLQ